MESKAIPALKPAFSYYGGKQRIASQILPYINAIPHTCYVEPFAGGATLLFAKPQPIVSSNSDYREVLNDINDFVVLFYRVAIEQPEALNLKLQATLYSQSDHRKSAEILRNAAEYSSLEIAWAFYVNIQQSFSNSLFCGWRTSVVTRNQAATWANFVSRLPDCIDRLKSVHVSSEDALRCIERWDSPHSLFYLDPPYPGSDQQHYSGYTLKDWENLCDLLDRIQGSYVLSNYPQSIEPQSAQQRIEIDAVASSSGQGQTGKNRDKSRKATAEELGDRKRTEVLWICDRSANMRKELSFAKHRQTSIFEVLA